MTKKPECFVTDHAVIQYLARCRKLDIDAIREEILEIARPGIHAGAHFVKSQGLTYVLDRQTVITVTPGGATAAGRVRNELPNRQRR